MESDSLVHAQLEEGIEPIVAWVTLRWDLHGGIRARASADAVSLEKH